MRGVLNINNSFDRYLSDNMKVADFFCGAGGFSEGFRQAGFEIAFALDNWKPAIATHELNHPRCKHHLGDILAIEPDKIDEIVPDTEIIIGSPPCVAFSHSNNAGKADKSLGLALINKYLQIVAHKKNKKGSVLKYWIMENVPNSARYVQEKYTFDELGLPGGNRAALEIKRKGVFIAADFGAPQTRQRFVCGDFPEPEKTNNNGDWVTLGEVLTALGSPAEKPAKIVNDRNYGFSIPSRYLTDHYYDTTVERWEWKQARRQKEDHGYMGKMSFPERLDKPSRTIMATQSAVSRESMILGTGTSGRYRLPTIREIACLMSFPITYQFAANSEAGKYRLVGNAVCVKLSKALAYAISDREELKRIDVPNPHKDLDSMLVKLPMNLNGRGRPPKQPPRRRNDARFKMHVPDLKISGYRVELDNMDSRFEDGITRWAARLHKGTGKSARQVSVESSVIEEMFDGNPVFKSFKVALAKELMPSIPSDAAQFQSIFCRTSESDKLGPQEALEGIKGLLDKHFADKDSFLVGNLDGMVPIGEGAIPGKILAALYACQSVAEGTALKALNPSRTK